MSAVLHLSALAATVAASVLLLVRPRAATVPVLAASIVMVVAMADLTLWRAVPAVWWSAVQLGLAIVVAIAARHAGSSRRAGDGGSVRGEASPLAVHAALGLVVMSACASMMLPDIGPSGQAPSVGGHDHVTSATLQAAATILVAGYVVVTARQARWVRRPHHRAHAGLMAMAAVAMLLAVSA